MPKSVRPITVSESTGSPNIARILLTKAISTLSAYSAIHEQQCKSNHRTIKRTERSLDHQRCHRITACSRAGLRQQIKDDIVQPLAEEQVDADEQQAVAYKKVART